MAKKFKRQAPSPSSAAYEDEPKRPRGRPRKDAATNGADTLSQPPRATKPKDKVRILTPVGMISYPHLAAKDEGRTNSDGRYKCDLIFSKDTWKNDPATKVMKQKVLDYARKCFNNPDLEYGDFKSPFRAGSERPGLEYQEAAVFIIPKSQYKPTVIGPNKKEWSDERIAKIKGGDFVRISANVFYYPNKDGGISLALTGVQFAREGEALGSGKAATLELFDELEEELEEFDEEDMEGEEEEEQEEERPRKKAKAKQKAAPVEEEEEEEDDFDDDDDEGEDEEDDDELQI